MDSHHLMWESQWFSHKKKKVHSRRWCRVVLLFIGVANSAFAFRIIHIFWSSSFTASLIAKRSRRLKVFYTRAKENSEKVSLCKELRFFDVLIRPNWRKKRGKYLVVTNEKNLWRQRSELLSMCSEEKLQYWKIPWAVAQKKSVLVCCEKEEKNTR